ncbi:MAG: PfkB family carbohydrate kinase [Nitrososphaerales archaeon]
MVSIAIVGHLCIDWILFQDRIRFQIGGPTYYGGITSSKFNMNTFLVTKYGPDFPEEYMKFLKSFNLKIVKGAKGKNLTTKFKHKIKEDKRISQLLSKCDDVEESQLDELSPEAILIDPVAQEVSFDFVKRCREKVSLLALDPQGFLRRFYHNGYVYLNSLKEEILSLVDIIKADREELKILGKNDFIKSLNSLSKKVKTLLITLGKEGAFLVMGDKAYKIKVPKIKLVEPIGAGDITLSSFLSSLSKGEEALYSACLAVACGTLSMERNFKSKIPSIKKIKEVGEELFEKVEKINL